MRIIHATLIAALLVGCSESTAPAKIA